MQQKKYKPGKQERSEGRYCENIVKQQFRPGRMNEIWAEDITYLKTKLGWVYLAVVMDLYNREVIGYAVSRGACLQGVDECGRAERETEISGFP